MKKIKPINIETEKWTIKPKWFRPIDARKYSTANKPNTQKEINSAYRGEFYDEHGGFDAEN